MSDATIIPFRRSPEQHPTVAATDDTRVSLSGIADYLLLASALALQVAVFLVATGLMPVGAIH